MIREEFRNKEEAFLVAEHHNFGLMSYGDWQKSIYYLYDDGCLEICTTIGELELFGQRFLSDKDLQYIKSNVIEYIREAPEINGNDGDAWSVSVRSGEVFPLGYLYNSELEKLCEMLEGYNIPDRMGYMYSDEKWKDWGKEMEKRIRLFIEKQNQIRREMNLDENDDRREF